METLLPTAPDGPGFLVKAGATKIVGRWPTAGSDGPDLRFCAGKHAAIDLGCKIRKCAGDLHGIGDLRFKPAQRLGQMFKLALGVTPYLIER